MLPYHLFDHSSASRLAELENITKQSTQYINPLNRECTRREAVEFELPAKPVHDKTLFFRFDASFEVGCASGRQHDLEIAKAKST